jgi:hypothetical protein
MIFHQKTSLDSAGSVTRVPAITGQTEKSSKKALIDPQTDTKQSQNQASSLISTTHSERPSLRYQPPSTTLNLLQLRPSYAFGNIQKD